MHLPGFLAQGQILIGDKDVTNVVVRDRSVAMVYQQFINYPSLTVSKNIASPLKISSKLLKLAKVVER